MYQNAFIEDVLTQGCRIEDQLSYHLIGERVRKIILRKKSYQIISSNFGGETNISDIILPYSGHPIDLELKADLIENQLRFKLISRNKIPFNLNGIFTYDAFLNRGDSITIQNLRLLLRPSLSEEVEKNASGLNHIPDQLVRSTSSILLFGETGTGKTSLAKKIHDQSLSRGSYVHLNLSAYNPQLVESELFGHIKGAFTGALSSKRGALAQASLGTIFLDEIDSTSLELQSKLLLVLDEKKYRKVGSEVDEKLTARFIFSSSKDPLSLVEKGLMRKDFYFRLKSGFSLKLNPLRLNPEKIDVLVDNFCIQHNLRITKKLRDFYSTLPWPGNIRQLLSHLEQKRHLNIRNKIDFDFYDEKLLLESTSLSDIDQHKEIRLLKDYKQDYIKRAYLICEGNMALASKKLGVDRRVIKEVISA